MFRAFMIYKKYKSKENMLSIKITMNVDFITFPEYPMPLRLCSGSAFKAGDEWASLIVRILRQAYILFFYNSIIVRRTLPQQKANNDPVST